MMLRKSWFKSWPFGPEIWLVSLGVLIAPPSWAAPSDVSGRSAVFCELAALPTLPLSTDSTERFTSEELLNRVAESYRGLLEFAGDEFSEKRLEQLLLEVPSRHQQNRQLEKFFEPVPVAEQRSVALNESLTKLGDWVLLDAEERGLSQEMILTRLRQVVRTHVEHQRREQERVEETREERRHPGVETLTGFEFVRDTRYPNLGEAFRDPDGMIWGDTVKNADGTIRKMKHAEALEYCQSIGAELPTREDFVRLREYMGAEPGTPDTWKPPGYSPQILPGLIRRFFWSSSVHPDGSNFAYGFVGACGNIYYGNRDNLYLVRCVAR